MPQSCGDDPVPPPPGLGAEHIVDFDYFVPAGADADVYRALKRLHEDGRPDILWTPRHGGHWILTRSEDIRWVRGEPIVFSREEFAIPRGSFNRLMPPVNVDPPYHARFRMLLNPFFRPAAVAALRERARSTAVELIEALKPRGGCEFVGEFARVMPVVVFLDLLNLPTDRRDEFVGWAGAFINAQSQDAKDAAAAEVEAFLKAVLDAREADPGEDLFSRIVSWRRSPHFQDESEIMGMAMAVFLGGLDTVSAMMSFTAHHLASDPDARRRLVEEPALIPKAAEEFLRRHGLAMTSRVLKDDVVRKGVTLRKGDLVLVADPLAGIDERAYPNPLQIDFDRDLPTHDSFGNGVHRCVGEHLARMELIVFLEEWLQRIPEFRLDPAHPAISYSGVVLGMAQLGLTWEG